MINSHLNVRDPKAAILVYGRQQAEGLPQAAWFRAEDRAAVVAGAAELRLAILDLTSEPKKALAVGVHEGVLKGSGRMIVGAVEPEIYRRIEEFVSNHPSVAAAPNSAEAASAQVPTVSTESPGVEAKATAGTSRTASPMAPWRALQLGDTVLAAYWNEKRQPEGWWAATVVRIESNEFVLRWPNEPDYPIFKRAPKHVAILHPEFLASGK
jgi:hypothetical protein